MLGRSIARPLFPFLSRYPERRLIRYFRPTQRFEAKPVPSPTEENHPDRNNGNKGPHYRALREKEQPPITVAHMLRPQLLELHGADEVCLPHRQLHGARAAPTLQKLREITFSAQRIQ